MLRKIVEINRDKCIGCKKCAEACHEHAIVMDEDNKAKLVSNIYCDGLGDCLPACPVDAIKIELKDVELYSEAAVEKNLEELGIKQIKAKSALKNWPPQLKLCPVTAPYFNGCHLLIAADCTAFAYASMHHDFMERRVTLFGCSKLDNFDYTEKITNIISYNDIKSITIVRMEVPCCRGLENMVKQALTNSGKNLHITTRIISIRGEVLECY